MAVELKRYEQQVGISGQGVGVEGSVSLAGKAAAAEYLVSADMIATLGDAAGEYIEKKRKIKDAADSADYKTRLLKLNTDLATAKGKAMEEEVPYGEIYQTTYEPMMQQFEHDIYNAGYSRDILVAAQQNWAYDKASIRQKDVTDVERMDLANLTTKVKMGMANHYARFGYGRVDAEGNKNDAGDAEYERLESGLAAVLGEEQAKLFSDTLMSTAMGDRIRGAIGSDGPIEERLAAINAAVQDGGGLPDALAREVRVQGAAATAEILDTFNEEVEKVSGEVVGLIARDKLDYGSYNKLRDKLPPAQQLLLDNLVMASVEVESNIKMQDRSTRGDEAVQIMDLIGRFNGESIFDRNWIQHVFTNKDEPLTYSEVFEEGKKLSKHGQNILYIGMYQAMKGMADRGEPLETYSIFNAKHYDRKYPIRPVVKTIEFDETGKDFLAETFHYSRHMSDDLMGYLDTTFKNFVLFMERYESDPTPAEYLQFKRENFTRSISNNFKNVLDGSVPDSLTPRDRQIIKDAK
jgi:hypothetical protein